MTDEDRGAGDEAARLSELWESQALAWATAARAEGEERDRLFWDVSLPALLELLPEPAGFSIDVGCGEGRLTRTLTAKGYMMAGFDASPTLIRLAEEADPWGMYKVAAAAALPVDPGVAELVVASMLLHDLEDLDGALAEAARVLTPGGVLVFSVLHPMLSAALRADYFDRGRFVQQSRRFPDLQMPGHHRPVSDYLEALERHGFELEHLAEPPAPKELLQDSSRPLFLVIRARKR
jgi:SAM-dependent methyltransferase